MGSTVKLSKHDRYIEELVEIIEPNYDHISRNVVIRQGKGKKKKIVAEVDVIAIRGDRCDVFEVKCSPRIVKTRNQLNRIRKHLEVDKSFFYCGLSGALVEM